MEVGIGFHPQPFASDHEREEIGGLLSPGFLADVQPIAPAQHDSSERMFGRVIVQLSVSNLQVSSHRRPLVLRILERPAQRAFGKYVLSQRGDELAHVHKDRLGFPLP